jgi:histidinol-phosphate/aromatic aminotransferase/cobyric acid decarboxylase-like protein
MDPAHLHTDIITTLGDALVKMSTPQWNEMMQNVTATQRRRASQLLLQTEEVRLTLVNATLSEIVDELRKNEDGLNDGIDRLKTALNRFSSVENVLNGISSVISILVRAVPPPGVTFEFTFRYYASRL